MEIAELLCNRSMGSVSSLLLSYLKFEYGPLFNSFQNGANGTWKWYLWAQYEAGLSLSPGGRRVVTVCHSAHTLCSTSAKVRLPEAFQCLLEGHCQALSARSVIFHQTDAHIRWSLDFSLDGCSYQWSLDFSLDGRSYQWSLVLYNWDQNNDPVHLTRFVLCCCDMD